MSGELFSRGAAAGQRGLSGSDSAGPGDQGEVSALEEAGAGSPALGTLPLVVDHSGRRSAFDEGRLRQSIERAQRDAGEASTSLADEVADIVRFTLASRVSRASAEEGDLAMSSASIPLHADELGALVERALIEVGAAGTARSYIVARDRRVRARLAAPLTGGPSTGLEAASGARLPSVRGESGAEPFQGRRIVAALIEEVELLPAEAEGVAEAVATVLAGSGLRVVSTALVRELVSSQLLALGHGEALKRHESLGLPRHDLTQLFRRATAESLDRERGSHRFEEEVGRALVQRWGLDEALPGHLGEAHRRGDVYVAGLDTLHRLRVRSIPASLLVKGSSGPALASLGRVVQLARDVGEGLVIEDPETLQSSTAGGASSLEDLVLALGAAGTAAGRRIDLAWSSGDGRSRDSSFLPWVLAVRAGLLAGAPLPRILAPLPKVAFAVRAGGALAGDAVELLLRSGYLIPTWSPKGAVWAGQERRVGKAGARERGSLGVGATVALNLPRLARRAGPWREDAMLESLSASVEFAVETIKAIAQYQDRARGLHGSSVADRICHTVIPVGLLDGLRILGDGIARAGQGARLLGFLSEAAGRLGAAAGLDIRMETGCLSGNADRAAAWFASCDARLAGPGQPRLFSELPTPEDERPVAYRASVGSLTALADAARVRARAEALGTLYGTVPSGALLPDEALLVQGRGAESALEFLETLARAPRVSLEGAAPDPSAGGEGQESDLTNGPAKESEGGPQGPSGAPKGDTTVDQGSEFEVAAAVSYLASLGARWPRVAAWARFVDVRSSGARPLVTEAETTLF